MPKRLFAILFASLASLMLLAHGIIPHHHHGEVICFEVLHCHGCDKPEHSDCPRNHHDPVSEKEDGCCLLNQLVIFHTEGSRHNFETAGKPVENEIPDALKISVLSYSFSLVFCGINLPFRQHPPDPTYLTEYLCQTIGMRAPPVV